MAVGGALVSTWVTSGNSLRGQFFKNATIEDQTTQAYWDRTQAEVMFKLYKGMCYGTLNTSKGEFTHLLDYCDQ